MLTALLLFGLRGGQAFASPPFAVARLDGVTIAGLPAVTGHIHVDQFGYLPDEDKVAVISAPVHGYNSDDHYAPGNSLELRKRDGGAVVFSGPAKPWNGLKVHEDSGDRGWWFDFSAFNKPGEYYVFDPSTQKRSPIVRIGP